MVPPDFTLPAGLELETIMFLNNPGFAGSSPDNAMTRVLGPNGVMVWLEELVRREDSGKTVWRVAGVLNLPPINTDSQVVVLSKHCTVGERNEPNVVAVATPDRATLPWLTRDRKST